MDRRCGKGETTEREGGRKGRSGQNMEAGGRETTKTWGSGGDATASRGDGGGEVTRKRGGESEGKPRKSEAVVGRERL